MKRCFFLAAGSPPFLSSWRTCHRLPRAVAPHFHKRLTTMERLVARELKAMQRRDAFADQVRFFPVGDCLTTLQLVLRPNFGAFEDMELRFDVQLSDSYPGAAPQVTPQENYPHPNFDSSSICFNMLESGMWLPTMGLADVATGLLWLLDNPDLADPLTHMGDDRGAWEGSVVEASITGSNEFGDIWDRMKCISDWPPLECQLVSADAEVGDEAGGAAGEAEGAVEATEVEAAGAEIVAEVTDVMTEVVASVEEAAAGVDSTTEAAAADSTDVATVAAVVLEEVAVPAVDEADERADIVATYADKLSSLMRMMADMPASAAAPMVTMPTVTLVRAVSG
eukprot:PLAT15191.1.p1 GENE.PLAT15191.1~~PLAT15191.1.p1  ORF type:complete len:338 (-),score=58.46 PLAT15191.1:345-1358(-)